MGTLIVIGALLVAFGWIIPLVAGLVMLGSPRRPLARRLCLIGGIWALPGLGLFGYGLYWLHGLAETLKPQDFNPATYSGKTVTISTNWPGECEMMAYWRGNTSRFLSKNGRFIVPAEPMNVHTITIRSSQAGTEWKATSTFRSGSGSDKLTGANRTLTLGPPYTAQVRVPPHMGRKQWIRQRFVQVTLEIADSGGNQATLLGPTGRTGRSFEAFDAQNRPVWSGNFSYG